MDPAYTDTFGFVPVKVALEFQSGRLDPVDAFDEAVANLPSYTNPDGYVYPPITHTMRQSGRQRKPRKVPGSERGSALFNLPATHQLRLWEGESDIQKRRHEDAGFIMHFFGFLHGHQCQFAGWWMDKRYRTRSGIDHVPLRPRQAIYCLDGALAEYRQWPPRQRTVATNILYLQSRIWGYEMEWERFQAAYQVADAIFALGRRLGRYPKSVGATHIRRIPDFCTHFGMQSDDEIVESVVRLRNDLLHEALWDGTMPGHAHSDTSFRATLWLEHFSRRAFLRICGFDGSYVRSPWWGMGSYMFDIGLPSPPVAA